MSDSDTRKELLAAKIRIDELTEDLVIASAKIERLKAALRDRQERVDQYAAQIEELATLRGLYAADRDARRVMRALRHEDVTDVYLQDKEHPDEMSILVYDISLKSYENGESLLDWERKRGLDTEIYYP